MNKILKKVLITVLSLTVMLSMIGLYACKKEPAPVVEPIQITETEVTVGQYFTRNLTVTYLGKEQVVWSSDNTSIATVNANGVVTGVGVGQTTVTVKAGTASDTCIVNVTAFDKKSLVVSVEETSLDMYKDETYTINPTLSYIGQNVVGNFSYVSGNESVVTVSNSGVISAVGIGQASVLVKGEMYGNIASAIINVNVANEVTLTVDTDRIDLHYEADAQKGYINEYTPTFVCTDKGQEVANPELDYEIITYEETDVFAIENGKIVAKNGGSALLSVTYTNANGESANVMIAVNVYTVEKTLSSTPIAIDVTSENSWFDYSTVNGIVGEVVSAKIGSIEEGFINLKLDTNESKKLVNIGKTHGESTLVLTTRNYVYSLPVQVSYTLLLNNENISALKDLSNENVKLVEDIDFNNYFTLTGEEQWITSTVFNGLFDGDGYSINNLICGEENGLFKTLGGSIKNLGIKNATSFGGGVLAKDSIQGETLNIENVFVKIRSVAESVESFGALFSEINSNNAVTIKNVVISMPKSTMTGWGFVATNTNSSFNISDCSFINGNSQIFGVTSNSYQLVGTPTVYEDLEEAYDGINAGANAEVINGFKKVFVYEISNENKEDLKIVTDEYVILTEDIAFNFSEEAAKDKSFSTATFTGVLDGQGYSIGTLCLRSYDGLFSKLGGVVKNLSLTAGMRGHLAGAIASELCGNAKVSDVYISLVQPAGGTINQGGVVCTVGSGYTLTVNNCFITGDRDVDAASSQGCVSSIVNGTVILNNCYFMKYTGVAVPEGNEISSDSGEYEKYTAIESVCADIMSEKIEIGDFVEGIILAKNPIKYISQKNIADLMTATEGQYKLVEDIDMTGINWTAPVFTGVLDGGGYSISNLSSTLFTTSAGSTLVVKNIAFLNDSSAYTISSDMNGCTITVENAYFHRVGARGQFTGVMKEIRGNSAITFRNCAVFSEETGTNSRAGLFAGRADAGTLTFDNCYGIIANTSTCSSTVMYHSHSGGINVVGTADENYFVRSSKATILEEASTNDKINLTATMLAKYVK